MLKTLATKRRSTVAKMARRYKTTIESPIGPRGIPRHHRTRARQEITGRPLRRDPAQASRHSRLHRPTAGHGQHPAQRVDPSSRRRTLRDLRAHRESGGSPPPQARRPQPARQAGQTRLDAPYGHATTQDPRHLPPLPRRHPRRSAHHDQPTLITGERGAGRKLPRPVREQTDGTGPQPRTPRQRSTSL